MSSQPSEFFFFVELVGDPVRARFPFASKNQVNSYQGHKFGPSSTAIFLFFDSRKGAQGHFWAALDCFFSPRDFCPRKRKWGNPWKGGGPRVGCFGGTCFCSLLGGPKKTRLETGGPGGTQCYRTGGPGPIFKGGGGGGGGVPGGGGARDFCLKCWFVGGGFVRGGAGEGIPGAQNQAGGKRGFCFGRGGPAGPIWGLKKGGGGKTGASVGRRRGPPGCVEDFFGPVGNLSAICGGPFLFFSPFWFTPGHARPPFCPRGDH